MTSLIAYLLACLDLPMAAPVCRDWWTTVMVASFMFGGATLTYVLYRTLDYRLKLAAALKAEAHRLSANVVEIERVKWPENPTFKIKDGMVEWPDGSKTREAF